MIHNIFKRGFSTVVSQEICCFIYTKGLFGLVSASGFVLKGSLYVLLIRPHKLTGRPYGVGDLLTGNMSSKLLLSQPA